MDLKHLEERVAELGQPTYRARQVWEWAARGASDGTGLSIVRALVRDELRGSLELSGEAGLHADVRFPA